MDEKKIYPFSGKVEISAEEYRDIIERMISAEKEAEEQRSERWRAESKYSNKEKEFSALKEKVKDIEQFLARPEIYVAYKSYLVERRLENAGKQDAD